MLAADGYTCQDKLCTCHVASFRPVLDAHHIVKRSLGGSDSLENGVTLCRAAHELAESGYSVKGEYVTPTEHMICILQAHIGEPHFRWADAIEHLRQCRDRKLKEVVA